MALRPRSEIDSMNSSLRLSLLAAVTALALGCGSSHDRDGSDAGSGGGDGSIRTDAGGGVDSGPIPGVDAGLRSCGGFAGEACRPGEWCDYPDGSFCGGDDTTGICQPRPEACDLLLDPVCGCDGVTYGNECAANSAGVDIASRGECAGTGVPCTNDMPCTGGMVCVGSSCGEVWQCVGTTRPCTDDAAPHCGCDGVTFYDSSTCQTQPYAYSGPCEDGVSCDARDVLCRALPPECGPGQAPSVSGSCWGPCVDVGYCQCETDDECPADYPCTRAVGRCDPLVHD
jgi:hypothetical protein